MHSSLHDIKIARAKHKELEFFLTSFLVLFCKLKISSRCSKAFTQLDFAFTAANKQLFSIGSTQNQNSPLLQGLHSIGVASKEFSEKAIPDFCISKRVQVEGRSEGGSLPDPVASPSHCHCQPLPTPLIVKLIYPLLHNFLPFEKILNISNNSFFPMLFCIFKFQIIISFPMFSGFIKIFHCRLSNFPIPEFLCR